MLRVSCMFRWGGRGAGACGGLKELPYEPPLLIADIVKQAVLTVTLWTFSTRAVVYGVLLLSAWPDMNLLRYHCLLKDWRYSLADI